MLLSSAINEKKNCLFLIDVCGKKIGYLSLMFSTWKHVIWFSRVSNRFFISMLFLLWAKRVEFSNDNYCMIKFSVTRRLFGGVLVVLQHHLYDLVSSSVYDLGHGRCIWYRWWYQERGPVFRGPLILLMMRTFLKVSTLGFQMKFLLQLQTI